MLALLCDKGVRLVNDYPQPRLLSGEALIRMRLAGICATDRELASGYKGFRGVLGHEFVGTVVGCEVKEWLNRRVVGEINISCGTCAMCLRGEKGHCLRRTVLGIHGRDGALAEFFTLPVACLHRVPDHIPDLSAVFVEPLAAALEVLEMAHVRPSEKIVVLGDGKLGILVAQVLRLTGCEVTLVGRHPKRWEWLRRLGINCNSRSDMPEHAADAVVDCTGNPRGISEARQLLRSRGRLFLKSTLHGTSELDVTSLVVDEIAVIPSRCGPFAPALNLLERKLIETEPMIEAVYPLSEAQRAFEEATGRLKILVSGE